MISESIRIRLSELRESGDIEGLVYALVQLAESTPLFSNSAVLVRDWIVESRELAATCILDPGLEVRQSLRHAQVLLALGQPVPSYAMARRAEALAKKHAELGLQDRAIAVASRALVRMGRHEDALTLLEGVASRQLHPLLEDSLAPALCFLAVGESHLCEGRYSGASGPLEEALSRLDESPAFDRLRWDVLMGLAMLDHRFCALDRMTDRLEQALTLAERHQAVDACIATKLVFCAISRARSQSPVGWLEDVLSMAGTSLPLRSRWRTHRYITERLIRLVSARSYAELSKLVGEQATSCGADRDLLGYLILVSIAAAVEDAAGRLDSSKSLLVHVTERLREQDQLDASKVLQLHKEALESLGG
jgi:hypothetical protein